MLATRPRIAPRRPIGLSQQIPVGDVVWKSKWPHTITTIIAVCFTVILLGVDAKAIKDGITLANDYNNVFGVYIFYPKYKVLAAQLAFACVELLLCVAFIIIYIYVLIVASKNINRPKQQLINSPPLP